MTAQTSDATELATAIAGLYGGQLEDFVSRRDALAKELRSSGKRDLAGVVKALRKPSRQAWALDLAAQEGQGVLDSLVAAVAATLSAQTTGGDVRAAMGELRRVVREFAGHAARAAEQAGHRLEPGALATALLAVLGTPDSFAALRRGALADVPEAGGLDFLAGLSTPTAQAATATPADAAAPGPSSKPATKDAAAREAVQRAATILAAARERSDNAQRALREIESQLNDAEVRLRQAEADARQLRNQRDRARHETEVAAAQVREAEAATAEAMRQG